MRIRRGFSSAPRAERAVTLGVFDGLHRGHAKIIKTLVRRAQAAGLKPAVITFTDHPHGTLAPEQRPLRLCTQAQRLARLQDFGVQELFLIPFSQRLARLPAETFVRKILVARLGLRRIVVGEDFVFGNNAGGDTALLRRLGRTWGFGVTVVPFLRLRGRIISSTGIRRLLLAGRVRLAGQWLGWPYALHGRVVRGAGRGARLGLPTANLRTVHELIPGAGVYAVWARLRGKNRPAVCHIGPCPTFGACGPDTVEVHIPGWHGPLYGEKMEVQFVARLRGIKKFSSGRALAARVAGDWKRARRLLQKNAAKMENFD